MFLIPTRNHARILPAFFSHIYKLKTKPDLTVFYENNSVDDTLKKLKGYKLKHEVIQGWFKPKFFNEVKSRYEVIARARQRLLNRARGFDPDYAVFLDDDVYPVDTDLIWKLTHHEKDVVGGPYQRHFPFGLYLASFWDSPSGRLVAHEMMPRRLEEVVLTSAGCMCLSRKIIQDQRVNFYPLINDDTSEDFQYCRLARKYGYQIWLDGTVQLYHAMKEVGGQAKAWSMKDGKYVPFYFSDQK